MEVDNFGNIYFVELYYGGSPTGTKLCRLMKRDTQGNITELIPGVGTNSNLNPALNQYGVAGDSTLFPGKTYTAAELANDQLPLDA